VALLVIRANVMASGFPVEHVGEFGVLGGRGRQQSSRRQSSAAASLGSKVEMSSSTARTTPPGATVLISSRERPISICSARRRQPCRTPRPCER
jgi:hypothetical protein